MPSMERRFRIGLRLLLLGTALFAVCVAWLAELNRLRKAELGQVRIGLEAKLDAQLLRQRHFLNQVSDPVQKPAGQRMLPTVNREIADLKRELSDLGE
ncbi:hypothetical protein I41_16360 [Lacipirellula limnantheis]|uniref:Uncharacterized protein n=2 Tax=Lacipirellula limnantheis TaxID=2528024 RepID=A0A517TVQ9_9BACT|nr:hypothetical protein I41_16360 [Lacipirellula limnantheis]